MIRRARLEQAPEVVEGFRMRGTNVSRLEAFVDCVFGFGLTLIVVSSQVPTKFSELLENLRSFSVFGLCFAVFFSVWARHYTYCRRYGMEDLTVRVLTLVLLFVMLVYLYPLKFLAVVVVTKVIGVDLASRPADQDLQHMGELFVIYGAGFAAIQGIFALLYWHAYRRRSQLRLDELEVLDTKWWTIEQALYLLVPLASIVIALLVPSRMSGMAGFAYFGMGIVGWVHGTLHGRRHRELTARLATQGALAGVDLDTENEQVEVPG